MQSGIHAAEIVMIMLLLFVAVFAALARKLKTPYPIVLVVAGLLISILPGIPSIRLDPNIVFIAVLPPLQYSAAGIWTGGFHRCRCGAHCGLAFSGF